MTDRYCIVCGENFEALNAWHKYCSRGCQSQRYRENKGIKLLDGRYCRQCGTHFVPSMGKQNQQHCSIDCAKKSARQSRSKFWEKFGDKKKQKAKQYYDKTKQKIGVDSNLKRFSRKYPEIILRCQSCGEDRVLDIAHKPKHKRNGSWRSAENTTPDKVWILCPTCHALLDRKHYPPNELGLKE